MTLSLPLVLADMAPLLGLSRPAAQCLGAIWRAAQAPSAEDLVAQLGLSRSNVSVSVKELRALGLVRTARTPGSRKDFFTADPDPWALLRQVIAERQRREFAPLSERLAQQSGADPRIADLIPVAQAVSDWMAQIARLEPDQLQQLLTAEQPKKKKKKKG